MDDTTKEPTELERLRAELAKKKASNEAHEAAKEQEAELARVKREIVIEEKRAEAYAAGFLPEQLFEAEWPAIGRCLIRTPSELVYNKFAKSSGMLKGELKADTAVYEELALSCVIVPEGKEFLDLARKRCPHASVQLGSALLKRMRDRLEEEGK